MMFFLVLGAKSLHVSVCSKIGKKEPAKRSQKVVLRTIYSDDCAISVDKSHEISAVT